MWFKRMQRNKPPITPLPLSNIPWLSMAAALSVAPHFEFIPPWLAAAICGVIAIRFWLWKRGRLTPPRFLIFALVCAGTASILIEYRTLLGREAGVALLAVFMALKLLELKSSRDAVVVVLLGYFLLLTQYFYSEDIPVGLWMLLSMIVTTASLIRLQTPYFMSNKAVLSLAAQMIFQAIPIMLLLYLLFPRISGPLWGLPQDTRKATSGLSEEMAPGSISELSQSSALAFRVEFTSAIPAKNALYWRGPVLTDYDGRNWRVARNLGKNEAQYFLSSTEKNSAVTYAITLEPHQQRWLLALEMPVSTSSERWLNYSFSLQQRSPIRDRIRYELTSHTQYKIGVKETNAVLLRSLALPQGINPLSRTLAEKWRKEGLTPQAIAVMVLQLFREDNFVYTLRPPLLGTNAIDEFIFQSKRGFCEHYAAAFVFLLRAAGVPARVIGGYQGGEINPIDQHISVRQSDAHAWAEIWVEKEGWIRIDPTAAIAPNRIEQGLQASLPESEPLPTLMRAELDWLRSLRYRWDAANNAWNRWVLGYNEERQKKLLQNLGLGNDWKTLVALLSASIGIGLLLLVLLLLYKRKRRDPLSVLWDEVSSRFAKHGLPRLPYEGPQTYLERVAVNRPDLARLAKTIEALYIPLRYGHEAQNSLQNLRAITRQIPSHWSQH